MHKALTIIITIAVTGLTWASPTTAAPGDPVSHCRSAWKAPRSAHADACRDAGWTIRPRLVVTPRALLVRTRLPVCEYRAKSPRPCLSNEARPGALTFWLGRLGTPHYLWTRKPSGLPGAWDWPDARQRRVFQIPASAQVIEGIEHVWVRYPDGEYWSA